MFIQEIITENTIFGDLEKNELDAWGVWGVLLMAGYLKVISQRETNQGLLCKLAVPNQEVKNLYCQIIEQWLSNGHGILWYNLFLEHLLQGDLKAFERDLRQRTNPQNRFSFLW